MISSIWTAYGDVPNTMPAGNGTNTQDWVAFFLFWVGSLPAIWFPVHKIRHLFTVKAYFVPVAGLAFFIWAIRRADGIGPIVRQPGKKSGNALGWAMVTGIMSSIANFATLIVNVSDPLPSQVLVSHHDSSGSGLCPFREEAKGCSLVSIHHHSCRFRSDIFYWHHRLVI